MSLPPCLATCTARTLRAAQLRCAKAALASAELASARRRAYRAVFRATEGPSAALNS